MEVCLWFGETKISTQFFISSIQPIASCCCCCCLHTCFPYSVAYSDTSVITSWLGLVCGVIFISFTWPKTLRINLGRYQSTSVNQAKQRTKTRFQPVWKHYYKFHTCSLSFWQGLWSLSSVDWSPMLLVCLFQQPFGSPTILRKESTCVLSLTSCCLSAERGLLWFWVLCHQWLLPSQPFVLKV